MRKRKVLSDNEWADWIRAMKSAFERGTILNIWKTEIEMEWFNPDFREFLEKELIPKAGA